MHSRDMRVLGRWVLRWKKERLVLGLGFGEIEKKVEDEEEREEEEALRDIVEDGFIGEIQITEKERWRDGEWRLEVEEFATKCVYGIDFEGMVEAETKMERAEPLKMETIEILAANQSY